MKVPSKNSFTTERNERTHIILLLLLFHVSFYGPRAAPERPRSAPGARGEKAHGVAQRSRIRPIVVLNSSFKLPSESFPFKVPYKSSIPKLLHSSFQQFLSNFIQKSFWGSFQTFVQFLATICLGSCRMLFLEDRSKFIQILILQLFPNESSKFVHSVLNFYFWLLVNVTTN